MDVWMGGWLGTWVDGWERGGERVGGLVYGWVDRKACCLEEMKCFSFQYFLWKPHSMLRIPTQKQVLSIIFL